MTGPGAHARVPTVVVLSLVLWLPALASLLDGGLTPATAAGRYVGSLVFATVAVAVVAAALRGGAAEPDPTAGVAPDAGLPDDGVPRRRAEDHVVDADVAIDEVDEVGEEAPAR